MTSAPTIVFDLDGTLVDTAPDLTGALNRVLAEEGYKPVSPAETRRMVGHGARALIENALAAVGAQPDQGRVDRLFGRYLAHYGAHVADESAPFEGVRETLDALLASGARLAVCTNKSIGLSEDLLAALDMRRYFGAVLGGDSLTVRKPHPEHLIETVRRAGGRPDRAVMVGDSRPDVEAARGAGIPVVVVTFGYRDEPIEDLGADVIVDHYRDMLPALRRLAPPGFLDTPGGGT